MELDEATEELIIHAWHFTTDELRDGRPVSPVGEWLRHDGPVVMCGSGLHASRKVVDALTYAPNAGDLSLHRVACRGDVEEGPDKLVARERRILYTVEAEPLLRAFARWCALQVVDAWDAPDVVLRYLSTGDLSLRSAAHSAARLAARPAACSAAHSAACSAACLAAYWAAFWAARPAACSAAHSAAHSAARSAAYLAADLVMVADSAARSAAREEQETALLEFVAEARRGVEEWEFTS